MAMTPAPPDVICIGAVLWDLIGRTDATMRPGYDVPGRVTRLPGGVALNVAVALQRRGLRPTLLTVIGDDDAGEELLAFCRERGLATEHVLRGGGLATDRYLAIEDA